MGSVSDSISMFDKQKEISKDRTIHAKEIIEGKVTELPVPYIMVNDTGQSDNLAVAINILATKGYEVISEAYGANGHFVIMKITTH